MRVEAFIMERYAIVCKQQIFYHIFLVEVCLYDLMDGAREIAVCHVACVRVCCVY